MTLSIKSDYQDNTWTPATDPIEFDLVSTPSTTYSLVFIYDFNNKDDGPYKNYYPTSGGKDNPHTLCDMCARVSDNIQYLANRQVTKEAVLNGISIGKTYRTFYMMANTHGGYANVTGVDSPSKGSAWLYLCLHKEGQTNDRLYTYEIYDELKDANNTMVLSFDCCFAGGADEGVPGTTDMEIPTYTRSIDNEVSFADQLMALFTDAPKQRDAEFTNSPNIQFWMGTSSSNVSSWYYPKNYTFYSFSFDEAYHWLKTNRYIDASTTTNYDPPRGNIRWNEFLKQVSIVNDRKVRQSKGNELSEEILQKSVPSFSYIGKNFMTKIYWS